MTCRFNKKQYKGGEDDYKKSFLLTPVFFIFISLKALSIFNIFPSPNLNLKQLYHLWRIRVR